MEDFLGNLPPGGGYPRTSPPPGGEDFRGGGFRGTPSPIAIDILMDTMARDRVHMYLFFV